jgi:hypothetical protein
MGTGISLGIGIPFRRMGGGAANTARTQAFLTATGITDATIISALNTLDNALITAGLLPSGTGAGKIKALYPFVGGTATTHKFNFVDPRDLDAAFRIEFLGGWTHSANGILGNASNTQAVSKFQMLTSFRNNIHWYTYQRIPDANNGPVIAASPNSGSINFYTTFAGNIFARLNGTGGPHEPAATKDKGFFASRLDANNILVGRNGVYNTFAQSSDPTNNEILILGGNSDLSFSSNQFSFWTLGEGLTNSEGINLNSASVTFQTTLGRNV